MKFKIIFSIQCFLYNRFYFQYLLSQNSFLINQIGVSVPIVFSYFNSVNGFKIVKGTATKLMWFQITLMAFNLLREDENYTILQK